MTLCPIALAVGCRKCPIFKVCPVKTVIGDYTPPAPPTKHAATSTKRAAASTKRPSASTKRPSASKKRRR
ncbi:MAG: hypothetical protein ABI537_07735 [Casimicrobiaceae bacterium]